MVVVVILIGLLRLSLFEGRRVDEFVYKDAVGGRRASPLLLLRLWLLLRFRLRWLRMMNPRLLLLFRFSINFGPLRRTAQSPNRSPTSRR